MKKFRMYKMNRNLISKLLGISEKSFYRWKNERLVFKLFSQYFTDNEIKEFLDTGKIEKFELINNKSVDELKELLNIKNEQLILDEITRIEENLLALKSQLNIK